MMVVLGILTALEVSGPLVSAMRKHGQPEAIVTDRLRSYGAALKEIGSNNCHETGR